MGDHYPRITASNRPPPGVKIDRLAWKTRYSRAPEDTTFVVVEDELIPGFRRAGVFELVIRSSNHGRAPFGDGWPDRALAEIKDRLGSNHGAAKGRVIYAIGQGWSAKEGFDHEIVLGALAYSLGKSGDVVKVLSLSATRDIARQQTRVLETLLICGERISTECSGGKKARVQWEVGSGLASTACMQFGFRRLGTARGNRVVLYRDGDLSSGS